MASPDALSEDFLALSYEEKVARIKAAGGSDRSQLPGDVQEWMSRADQRVAAEWEGQLGEPLVDDRRI